MAYQRHFWNDYDETKTETENIENTAVVTTELLNEIETGIDSKADKTFVDAQLAQKANNSEVRLNAVKLKLEDMSEDVLGAMSGEATFNLESIPQDNSVTPIKMTDKVKTTLYKELHKGFTMGTLNSNDGLTTSSSSRVKSEFMKVKKGFISFINDGVTQYAVFTYDNETNAFINATSWKTDDFFQVPQDVIYIRLILKYVDDSPITDVDSIASKVRVYSSKTDSDKVEEDKTTFFEVGKNLFNKSEVIKGHYVDASTGSILSSSAYNASDWIETTPNTSISMTNSYQLAMYDINKVFISGKASNSGNTFTTPTNCYYIRTSVHNGTLHSFQLEEGSTPTSFENFHYRLKDEYIPKTTNKNKLYGLKWGVIGDSISTLGYRAEGQEYPAVIAENNGMTLNNLAVPGSMITKSSLSGHETDHMCERVLELDSDCDVITVAGGVNDLRNNRVLGTFGDTEMTTFYGALDTLCRNMISKFHDKPKAIFTPLKYRSRNEDLQAYVNAIKEVASKYAIPVLDNHNVSDLQPDIDFINQTYFYNNDGLHPNIEGHKIVARSVENFLRSLV